MMQIFIRAGETHTFDVYDDDDVSTLKAYIEEVEDIPADEQVLYVSGRPLDEEVFTHLKDGDHVEVCCRLLGGKVHGSLARAGKVKGQTPKVEKQEKRKKKTGRAKRRMLYNKRFVNVVTVFGRRRGPNTNQ